MTGGVSAATASPIVVGIATSGRAGVLTQMLAELSRQIRPPDKVYICPADPGDVDMAAMTACGLDVDIVNGPKGSCHQRNAIMDRVADLQTGVLIFFDDDFFPMPDYLAQLEALFSGAANIVIATGDVLADGAPGPGLTVETARAVMARGHLPAQSGSITDVYNGYGCNLAVRLATVNRHRTRFDERLPLYAWLEDVDFSRRLAAHGRVVKSCALRGVHLGSKRGRTSGVRFGYSQIANPWYLSRKRTFRTDLAVRQVARNLAANLTGAIRPEPWVDRRGRLRGNLLALCHLVIGRLSPEHVFRLR